MGGAHLNIGGRLNTDDDSEEFMIGRTNPFSRGSSIVTICSTISKDNTCGENARKAALLAEYGKKMHCFSSGVALSWDRRDEYHQDLLEEGQNFQRDKSD
jgi:hypothetical protein